MITADKLLDYAKRIAAKNSAPEEESRSAISRAYYSLYHETLAIAIRKYSFKLIRRIERVWRRRLRREERRQLNALDQQFLKRCNFHRILPLTLIDINQPALAFSFKNFRDRRNEADYDLKRSFTHSNADTIVNNIDGLIRNIESL